MPSIAETEDVVKKAIFLQVMVVSCFRHRQAKRRAQLVVHGLQKWRKGIHLVLMKQFYKKVVRIQRFVRWSLKRIAAVRAQVELMWLQVEGKINQNGLQKKLLNKKQAKLGGRRTSKALSGQSGLVAEPVRRAVLTQELRERRFKVVPAIDVWRDNMVTYWRDVREWRLRRDNPNASSSVTPRTLITSMPVMPACPTHLPTESELAELIQRAHLTGRPPELNPQERKDMRKGNLPGRLPGDGEARPRGSRENTFVLQMDASANAQGADELYEGVKHVMQTPAVVPLRGSPDIPLQKPV